MISYSIKPVVIERRPDRSGKYQVLICISYPDKVNHLTKRIYDGSGIKVAKGEWDKRNLKIKATVKNHILLNTKLNNRINEIENAILQYQIADKPVNIRAILSGNKDNQDLLAYMDKIISQISVSQGRKSHYTADLSRLKSVTNSLTFDEVTPEWLRKFEIHLKESKLKNNTIVRIWKVLRKVFNLAINDGLTTNYPFRSYDNPKYKQTDRQWLTLEETDRVEEILKKPLSDGIRKAATYLLLGCYSGLRVSEWKRFNPSFIQGDHLILRTTKTGELIRFPIHAKLKRIIDEIFIVGEMDSEQKTNEYLKGVAKLAGINKHITTHTGRHSFAVRCAELGIDKSSCALFMGISERVCSVYYKVSNKRLIEEGKKWDAI